MTLAVSGDALHGETPLDKSYSQEHPYSSLRDLWRKSIFNKNKPYVADNIAEDAEQPESDYTEVTDVDIRPPQPGILCVCVCVCVCVCGWVGGWVSE